MRRLITLAILAAIFLAGCGSPQADKIGTCQSGVQMVRTIGDQEALIVCRNGGVFRTAPGE